MITAVVNLSEEEKAQVNFLCDVHNYILNKGTRKPKVTQTSILRDALKCYFTKNKKYLQVMKELGKFGALAKIDNQVKGDKKKKNSKPANETDNVVEIQNEG